MIAPGRARRALLAVALLLLPAAAAAEDPAADSVVPWDGLLPDPDQGPGKDERRASEWFGARVLDGATGLPVAGARLRRYPEWIQGGTLRHSFLLGEGTTDADGFAHVPALLHFETGDSHWVVDAPGFAPAYDYGPWPDRDFLLQRGEDLRGRVLDPLGRPVAGASVEIFLGCGHGPAVRTARTGADGSFALPCVPPGEGTLWILTPAGAADYVNLGPALAFGERPADFVLGPGATATGRVVDAAGDPIPGAIIRSWQEQRGPATLTDGDGRFVLEGVEPGHGFQVFHPSPVGDETTFVDDGWVEGVPVLVRMTAAGPVETEDRDGTLVVRARGPDGKPVERVDFVCVRLEDGSGSDGRTSDGDDGDSPAGETQVEVRAGRWRVLPGSRFDATTFDPVDVTVPKGGLGEATLLLRPQARLRIQGEFPERAIDLSLAIAGETDDAPDSAENATWAPTLPREGPATLWVRPERGPPFPFPVSPADAAGIREVRVSIPAPHVVRLPAGTRSAEIRHGGREVASREDEGALSTWATGRLSLRVEGEDRRVREVPIELPADLRVEIDATEALAAAPARGDAAVRFLGPDGAPVETECAAYGGSGRSGWGGESGLDLDPPVLLVARVEGWVPRSRFLDRPGAVEVRWGDASLDLELRNPDGEPADALVLAGGVVLPAPEGRVALGGFEAGTHELIACLRDEPGGGRRIRVTLKAGEKRALAVTLGDAE